MSCKFVLNVKAEHHIDSWLDEIGDIANLLREHAKDEFQYIFRVAVYGRNEKAYCMPEVGEILIYSEGNSC